GGYHASHALAHARAAGDDPYRWLHTELTAIPAHARQLTPGDILTEVHLRVYTTPRAASSRR
ncbi:MAG: hypothetical protein ACRDMV_12020, partial [Streptosporangiales bacterium]